jgi:putative transposase
MGPINFRNIKKRNKGLTFARLVELESADQSLVDILAYCLLPNHFHLVLKQKTEHGISKFLQKTSTAYSMYFNLCHGHSGTLFQGRFRSRHLDTDPYFKWSFSYLHLNPTSLVEPEWKKKGIRDPGRASKFLKDYLYSSYYDYYVGKRPERAILAYTEAINLIDKEQDFNAMLVDFSKGKIHFPVVENELS